MESVNGWKVSGENVAIEGNGDNDVKPSVIKEHVELKRESYWPLLSFSYLLTVVFLLELSKIIGAAAV